MAKSTHGPVQEKYRQKLNTLAAFIDRYFNGDKVGKDRGVGFALLIYEFGEVKDGRVNYIGNGQRADMLEAFKEVVARWEREALDKTSDA